VNILFLCAGNFYRSQIAEGWARHLGSDFLQVQSAGIEVHGVNPSAIDVMRDVGVDISRQESTRLTDQMLAAADYLVTVCGHADENCPVLPQRMLKVHWPLNDPAKATGSEGEVLAVFRESREVIRHRVADLIQRLSAKLRAST
jgi:arsenate reductase